MNSQDKMTMAQAQEKMACLKEVFTVVRLLDGQQLLDRAAGKPVEVISDMCPCYFFWEKDSFCDNCTSILALREKTQKVKMEFLEYELFQVISRYVEIDGKPYVMEMLKQLDESNLLDPIGYEKIINKFALYSDKLYKDALTGVYNRRYFEDEVKNQTESVGVAVIDLDDFKLYNDSYGHNAGDKVLITVVGTIKRCIRKSDTLIRYGGDEFLLILPDMKRKTFTQKLKEIQKQINATAVPGYSILQLSVSIGGVVTQSGESIEHAIGRADKLMYLAKTEKNMVVTDLDEASSGKVSVDAHEKIKQTILIVDDSWMNLEILTAILSDDYRILEASSGEECIHALNQYGTGISLVLLDIVMPGMNGFEVLTFMNQKEWIKDIPVIMISSEDSESYICRAYELGVSDYISRPFDSKIVYRRVSNTIRLYAKQRRLSRLVADQIHDKEKSNRMMVSILSQIVEFRNGESGLHVIHINLLTRLLLEQLMKKTDQYSLSWSDQYLITTASALHDIGKIGIAESILNKPGRLTDEEYEIMKTHTLIGADMLKSLDMYKDEKLVKLAYEICRWHHERYDGKGYPDGLKGEEIPISAQVVSLADVYDALISKRVYKKAYSHEKAMDMILHGECGVFNPILLECLVEIQDKLKEEIQVKSTSDFYKVEEAENIREANVQYKNIEKDIRI